MVISRHRICAIHLLGICETEERTMGPEYYWWHGMWFFPMIFPILGFTVMLVVVYLVFGRGFRPPWQDYRGERESEGASEILKKRYAKGEITKDEFDQMKKDLLA
jgi:putative membrane protein